MSISLPQNIKGIVFDLDGTLYKMKWFMKPLLTIMLFPRMLLLPRYIEIRKTFNGKDMQSGDKLLYAMAEKLSQKSGRGGPEAMFSWINNNFYKAFDGIMPLLKGSRPGVNSIMASLKEKGYRLAILSDFAHIEERLTGLDISSSVFDTIISSEQEGSLKPCTRPLLAIAESWRIQPSDILVIGDRADTDGIAADRAGMYFIRITDKKTKAGESYNWSAIKEGLSSIPSL